ncbi:hypothetical protein [Cerasicoccus frondis]|uniref:hypothetical protein n=1 Tax=Cerasicoccus frondis TaxID=490090 RepID=UPI0028525815|nr:hypothetical protein [Cerasicoccus frondis]
MPSRSLLITALLCLSAFVARGEMREWIDRQGRSFRGELYEVDEAMVKVRRESDFRIFELQLNQLSDADQQWIADQQKPKKLPPLAAPPEPEYPTKELDRSLIPSYNQNDFRNNGTCGPSALMNFMMWWGDQLYPEILASGSLDTKATRTMQRLIRTCDTSGGTHVRNLDKGLREYFDRYSPEYSVDIEWEAKPDTQWLEQATQGNNLVVLTLSYFPSLDGGRQDAGHFVSLATSSGDVGTVHTWGKIYQVKYVSMGKQQFSNYYWPPGMIRADYDALRWKPYLQAYRVPMDGEDPDRAGLWNEHVGIISCAMLAKIRPATEAEIAERAKQR